ncbi:MAG: DUF4349 domain-containing protein [Solobacterium sp.]|nr:DUF4349 domain-containing protein [Solobacterium sp.]
MKKWIKAFSSMALVIALTACGSSSGTAHQSYASDTTSYAAEEGAYGITNGYYDAEAADYEESRDEKTESGTTTPAITGEKLVYTGSMTIETLDYEETVKAVRERITSYQGIVQDKNEWDGDKSWYYTDGRTRTSNRTLSMTVRIPTEKFDAFMNDMEGTGKMTNRSENVQNISRQYSDNAIEIEALEKQQERLLQMMDAANTVEDMIRVEERLSEVQMELNQKKSRQSTMDTDVQYSTIYLNINEVQKYTPVDSGIRIDGFWEDLQETFQESWISFVYFLEQLALTIVRLLPFILLILLVGAIIALVRKAKGLDPNPFHGKPKKERGNHKIDAGTPKDAGDGTEKKE